MPSEKQSLIFKSFINDTATDTTDATATAANRTWISKSFSRNATKSLGVFQTTFGNTIERSLFCEWHWHRHDRDKSRDTLCKLGK